MQPSSPRFNRLMINEFSTLVLSTPTSTGRQRLTDLPYDLLLNIVKYLSVKDVINVRKTCRSLLQFSKTRSVWISLAYSIQTRRALPLPLWRSFESLNVEELENAVSHAARIETNLLKERPTPRPIFQVIDTSRGWGQINWLGQVPGGRYIIIFFRGGVLSVWDVEPETCGCVATMQTGLDHYTHTCETLQEEQAVLIGLATGAHDVNQEELGQFSVFKIDFPPRHPSVSISRVLEVQIDIPITGLFLERGLAGVVGPFHERTAALQIYDWKTRRGILLDTGIELKTDCDLDVIPFPNEIILYAEDSEHSILHTYTVENIRRMLSLVTHHNPRTVAQVGGGSSVESEDSDSQSSNEPSLSDSGSSSLATMQISLGPTRSCRRDIKDEGIGTFGAGYTMLKKCHMSSRDNIPYDGKLSILTMSLRRSEDDGTQVRCLTHHFLRPLASPSISLMNTEGPKPTYLPKNNCLSSPDQPLDDRPLRYTFTHALEQNAIAKGPTGYDVVSFGEGGTSAVWLAHTGTLNTDSDSDPYEHNRTDLEFWVATFPAASPNSPFRNGARRLSLPRTIDPSLTAALDLDDTQGVLCIATTRGEVFRLRFD
ncbi:unnamed protein product [Rhizoctonia solani]|uniref:F-box domain-containing protein n=1 Tax=Rhizoctonia solani TaxID=456999 RepID=A0A8H3BVH5_9AGAM|nr:unnamed protein product [Rhizoctonia solani]